MSVRFQLPDMEGELLEFSQLFSQMKPPTVVESFLQLLYTPPFYSKYHIFLSILFLLCGGVLMTSYELGDSGALCVDQNNGCIGGDNTQQLRWFYLVLFLQAAYCFIVGKIIFRAQRKFLLDTMMPTTMRSLRTAAFLKYGSNEGFLRTAVKTHLFYLFLTSLNLTLYSKLLKLKFIDYHSAQQNGFIMLCSNSTFLNQTHYDGPLTCLGDFPSSILYNIIFNFTQVVLIILMAITTYNLVLCALQACRTNWELKNYGKKDKLKEPVTFSYQFSNTHDHPEIIRNMAKGWKTIKQDLKKTEENGGPDIALIA